MKRITISTFIFILIFVLFGNLLSFNSANADVGDSCFGDTDCSGGICESCDENELCVYDPNAGCDRPCAYCTLKEHQGSYFGLRQLYSGGENGRCDSGLVCGSRGTCITECEYTGGLCVDNVICYDWERIIAEYCFHSEICCKQIQQEIGDCPGTCVGGINITSCVELCKEKEEVFFDPINNCPDNTCCCVSDRGYEKGSGIFSGITGVESGDLDYNDILRVGVNITKILLGIIGSIALLMFIFSGIKMIFSAGNEQQISTARNIMVQTIIGILITLGAYLIINFVQTTLDVNANYQINKEYKDSNF